MESLSQPGQQENARGLATDPAHILRILDDLWQARDEIDLDTIDGEFYFRCCLPGCEEQLVKARALAGAEGFAPLSAIEDLFGDYQIPRPVARAFVFYGHRLRLRHVQALIVPDEQHLPRIQPVAVQLDVFSGAWKGRDVAEYMEERRAQTTPRDNPAPPDSVGVNFRFHFHAGDDEAQPFYHAVGDGAQARLLESVRRLSPHVEVIVSVPMPPAELIAVAYDEMVRKHLNWHKKLAQASRQMVETALRTWTVALLCRTGLTVSDAMSEWNKHSGYPRGSDKDLELSKYYRDRADLYARVPEAKPSLAR